MTDSIELKNYGIAKYCLLNKETGVAVFFKGDKKTPGFTGIYFKDENTFFAIYPTLNGPVAFYEGKEYSINRKLTVTLQKEGKNRKFEIKEYNIAINYTKSPYIGLDAWSSEIDVDLFYMIEQSYLETGFYERYTIT